jgi:hypothetical protein
MHLQRLLQANFALLAALASLILGLGQRSYVLPLFGLAAAVGAWYWADVRGRIRIGGATANLAALVAAGITALDFSSAQQGQQLLSVANLLMYLQIIVLWQEKTVRIYWQLMSLSLLQVVVSAALADSVLFGLLLAGYFVFSTTALVLLFLWRESMQFSDRVVSTDAVIGPIGGDPAARPSPRRRWWSTPGWTRGDCVGVAAPGLLTRLIVRLVMASGVASILLGAVLFLMIPRSGRGTRAWTPDHFASTAITGFNESVQLGGLSHRVFQDDQIVMRVAFYEEATGRPMRPGGDLWLRGSVAIDYNNGRWRSTTWDEPADVDPPRQATNLVRQELTMEPLDVNRLFCIHPVFRLPDSDSRIHFGPALTRRDFKSKGAEPYVLATTGLGRREQFQIVPSQRRLDEVSHLDDLEKLLNCGKSRSDLAAHADTVLVELGADAPAYDQARALESHLRDSGLYQYSLSREATHTEADLRDAAQSGDPTVEFLKTSRSGHCEYFASALTLLLRSRGIPARMVLGYKSNEWNSVGGYLQVRQLHAHAWVEAYLNRGQIPDDLIASAPRVNFASGAWLRLDPTPGGGDVNLVVDSVGVWAAAKALFDHVDMLWRNSVLGFNRQRQHRWLYEPIYAELEGWGWLSGFRLPNWEAETASVWSIVLTSMLVYAAILGCVFGAVLVLLPIPAILRSWFGRDRPSRARKAKSPIDFYHKLEQLLERHGFRRGSGQTPGEFVAAIETSWRDDQARRSGSESFRALVDAYYQVRYGGRVISAHDRRALDEALDSIRLSLRTRPSRTQSVPSTI